MEDHLSDIERALDIPDIPDRPVDIRRALGR
jgi:hypothetical protein